VTIPNRKDRLVERMPGPSAGSELALRDSKGQALLKKLPMAKGATWRAGSLRLTAYGARSQ
jgi:hypothetical protein